MKNQTSFALGMFLALFLVCLPAAALAQTTGMEVKETKIANVKAQGGSVGWEVAAPHSGMILVIAAPDGRIFRKEFKAGAALDFTLTDKEGERLPDGQYTYELRLSPVLTVQAKQALTKARGKDDDPENVRVGRKLGTPTQTQVESGSFSIVNGTVIVAGGIEPEATRTKATQPSRPAGATAAAVSKLRLHHISAVALRSSSVMPDDVVPDDQIVQGSECVGFDCVNGESFGFDTIRLKENNTRIGFNDTSTSAGFPTRDWRLRANSSASGGASAFFIDDMGNTSTGDEPVSSTPFTLTSGAPTNSFFVASTGRVGLRTGTPVLDLHVTTSDTPAHRFEQTNAGGFTAQTWDIGANEANFFVRDVTGGSRLSFRIRPGAPTSSIDINASGNVGIGTASPKARIDLKQAEDSLIGGLQLRRSTTNDTWAMATASDNNLYMGYATNASAADANADFTIFPLVLTNNNRVGIGGTAAPDQTLSVNGDASKTGGGSWQTFSDERLKNIKGPFSSGLKAVMQLQPLRYEYKRDNALHLKSEGEHVGFGAQALQKIVPEAVTRSENGYLQVNNDPILWTMLNAIKEQQAQIEQLQEEVRQLRATAAKRRK